MDLVFYQNQKEIYRFSRIKLVEGQNVYESAEKIYEAIKNNEDWALDIVKDKLNIDNNITYIDDHISIIGPDSEETITIILEKIDTSDMEDNFGELPLGDPEVFVGEYEEMDLSKLAQHTYMVAISTGPRDKSNYIPSTARGPYDFYGMCEAVGTIYQEQQLHAKAIILNPDLHQPLEFLDECTIDFIEARFMDIVADGLLGGAFDDDREYTCQAGVIEHSEPKSEDTSE